MKNKIINFNDYLIDLYQNNNDQLITIPNITLQVTDDCCCNCSYCYQTNKGHNIMTKETADDILNLLFDMNKKENTTNFINSNTFGLLFDFIGGEPFLNIDIISYFCDQFMDMCLSQNHPWIKYWRAIITSNGTYYFDKKVQEFLNKYNNFIFLTITLDGPEEIHNTCRKYIDQTGQFADAYKAFKHAQKNFNCNSTKITISPDNLSQIDTIIKFFINENITTINANIIFEHQWTIEESQLFYKVLISTANILLEYPSIFCSLFDDTFFKPLSPSNIDMWCGGTGKMIAFDPKGIAYPCLRYMESSLNNTQPPLIIGNCKDGIYNSKTTQKIYNQLTNITRRSQSNDQCFYCPIASGCAYCSAWNYQLYGTPNSRCTYTCNMHKARALANVYYWNLYYQQNHINKVFNLYLPDEDCLQIISKKELIKLKELIKQNE